MRRIGIRKMAQISANITENELENIVNWRFSLDNIQAAHDRVLMVMENMELPNIYRKTPEKIHTASDGQKFEVRTDALNASRSFKYFGKAQGVSVYTFMDERHLLWHSLVFSASERESAYVIDGLMRNDVVNSDIHSTDTQGYSEAMFGATHLLVFPTHLGSKISRSTASPCFVLAKRVIGQTGTSFLINTSMIY